MNKNSLLKAVWIVSLLVVLSFPVYAQEMPAVVSIDWLAAHLSHPKLLLIDVRKVEYYQASHVPGAVNAFYGAWSFKKADLNAEIPDMDDLFELIGTTGIKPDSLVVVIGKTDTWQERVHMARVSCTLEYAGVSNVAILDGGHDEWVRNGKAVSTEIIHLQPVAFEGKINRSIFVKKDYILKNLGKILLVDVREPAYFTGKKKAVVATKAGRLPGAVNLPTSWMFDKGGTFKKKDELIALAAGVVGKDLDRPMITYCDTGTCCPTWHFILRRVLGYKNIYLYDGSIQEWTADPKAPVQLNHQIK